MPDTIRALRWVLFIACVASCIAALINGESNIWLYVIAIMLSYPRIERIFRFRRPKRIAFICPVMAVLAMAAVVTLSATEVPTTSTGSYSLGSEYNGILSSADYVPGGAEGPQALDPLQIGDISDNEKENAPQGLPESGQLTPIADDNAPFVYSQPAMSLHFIDVGQGDATLVECDGQYMLVDMGPTGACDALQRYLNDEGVLHIDYLVLTHPHADHINPQAAAMLTRRFNIGACYISDYTDSTGYPLSDYVLDILSESGVEAEMKYAGDTWQLGSATVTVKAPCASGYEDLNDYSLVLKVEKGLASALLCGDATTESEYEMIASGEELNATVLRVGHHGSEYSSSTMFLYKVKPDYAIISCGADNEYGHPHKALLRRLTLLGTSIYRTDKHGNIRASCFEDGSVKIDVSPIS